MAAPVPPSADPGLPAGKGCWGLRLVGLPGVDHLLVSAPAHWPAVPVEVVIGQPGANGRAAAGVVELAFAGAGRVTLRRQGPRVTLTVPRMPDPEGLIHPYLANASAILTKWLDRETFHAGAVVTGGGAWALVGQRESGKSTSLAWLEARGCPVVTDDVLAVGEGNVAYAGPRCLDLRQLSAESLGRGEPLGVVGDRERWRVTLGDVPPEVPLRGWIFLEWGTRVALRRLPFAEVVSRLLEQQAVNLLPDAGRLLQLATLPAMVLERPHAWSALDAGLEMLLERIGSPAAG